MSQVICRDFRLVNLAVVTFLIAIAIPGAKVIAQGLDAPNAMERIIGTDVREEEEATADEERQVIAAIENTGETINAVRMATSLNGIRIVFLSDAIASEGGPTAKVEAKIEEFNGEIRTLRQELEGNAILYHAIDSHHVLIRDVLAVEFDDQKRAIIYAAAKPVP